MTPEQRRITELLAAMSSTELIRKQITKGEAMGVPEDILDVLRDEVNRRVRLN